MNFTENMVQLPTQFRDLQGSMVRGDFYWIDVLLNDGSVHKGLTTNGDEIRGIWNGKGCGSWEHPLPFKAEDIRRVGPHSMWPFCEQILSFFALH
jgi:hypothetical protein